MGMDEINKEEPTGGSEGRAEGEKPGQEYVVTYKPRTDISRWRGGHIRGRPKTNRQSL